jgi:hypothetical protein
MYIHRHALLLSLVATASLVMSLPAHADRGDHGRNRHDRGHHNGHQKDRHHGGHDRHDRHWRSPPRHVYHHYDYRPRYVEHYAPPRYVYFAHGVYGYHEHCSHGHDYAYAPGYGSGLSLWLDDFGFSYYERGR